MLTLGDNDDFLLGGKFIPFHANISVISVSSNFTKEELVLALE